MLCELMYSGYDDTHGWKLCTQRGDSKLHYTSGYFRYLAISKNQLELELISSMVLIVLLLQEEAPSGMLYRGDYSVSSHFTDDDKTSHLKWDWKFEISKDW